MKTKEIIRRAGKLAKPFRITDGANFRLKDIDPGDTLAFHSEDKPHSKEALAMGIHALAELQDMLYAQDRWAVLLDPAGHGRGRQGRHDQACHVGPQSAGVQVFASSSPRARSWTTIICGGTSSACRNGAASASSIARITRRCWSCKVHPEYVAAERIPTPSPTKTFGSIATRTCGTSKGS